MNTDAWRELSNSPETKIKSCGYYHNKDGRHLPVPGTRVCENETFRKLR